MGRINVQDLLISKSKPKTEEFHSKYKPQKLESFLGNKETIENVKDYITNPSGIGFITGPVGSGKLTLAKLIIQSFDYKIIYFDNNTIDAKKQEFINHIKTLIYLHQRNVIVINHIDIIFGDTLFSKFVKMIKLHEKKNVPILLISSSKKIQKGYKKKNITQFPVCYPTFEECFPFYKHIVKKEHIDITNDALKFIINKCDCNTREILNILKILMQKKKTKLNLRYLKKNLSIFKGDYFFLSSEYIYEVINKTSKCHLDEIYSLYLFYSNIPNSRFNDIESVATLIEHLSLCSQFEHYCYKFHTWTFREYFQYAIMYYLLYVNDNKKIVQVKKNMYNNLGSTIQRRSQKNKCTSSRFKYPALESKYIEEFLLEDM